MFNHFFLTGIGLATATLLLISPLLPVSVANSSLQANPIVTNGKYISRVSKAGDSLAAPTNLHVYGRQTNHEMTLNWDDNSKGETGFEIQRSTGFDYLNYAIIFITGADVTSYTDLNLNANTRYTYRLRAVNPDSQSAYCAPVTTQTLYNPPADLKAQSVSTTQVHLSWTDTNAQVSGTAVYRKAHLSDPDWTTIFVSETTITEFTDKNLFPGTQYYYAVDAGCYSSDPVGCAHSWSDLSNIASVTTDLSVPIGFDIGYATAHLITLHWNDTNAGETGYEIQRTNHPLVPNQVWQTIVVTGPDETTFIDTGVVPCKIYWYRIRAVGLDTSSAYTISYGITTKIDPPINLQAKPLSPTQVELTWDEVDACTMGYSVYRKTDLSAQWTSLDSAPKTPRTYIDRRLEPGHTYYYSLTAACLNLDLNDYCQSDSDHSDAAAVTTPAFAIYLPFAIQ